MAQRYSLKLPHNLPEQIRVRVTFGKGDVDPAHTDADLRTDLEQLQANGVTLRLGHGSTVQRQAPQCLELAGLYSRRPFPCHLCY